MIRRFLILTAFFFASLAVAQVQLEYAYSAATYTRVLLLPNGDRLLVGSERTSSYVGPGMPLRQRSQIALMALGSTPFPPRPGTISPVLGGQRERYSHGRGN